MTKISKLLVGILFSALVISPSYAGEMTVTGGANVTTQLLNDEVTIDLDADIVLTSIDLSHLLIVSKSLR